MGCVFGPGSGKEPCSAAVGAALVDAVGGSPVAGWALLDTMSPQYLKLCDT